jgi:uncharacterized protein (TIGR02246 family)
METMPDARAIDALVSRDAIRQLVAAYCRGIDRGDAQLLSSIFWADATVVAASIYTSGAEFPERIVAAVTSSLDWCHHAVSNEWIEIDGDRAMGEHYVTAFMRAGGHDVTTGGRYLDRFQRRDGVWKIASRIFVADWSTSAPASAELDAVYQPGQTRGSFGTSDPVYAHWAQR